MTRTEAHAEARGDEVGQPHILIIVQNLPVPLDRRVWLECQALVNCGYRVSVICPKGPGDPTRQHIDGVDIYKYSPAPEAKGAAGFALEFAYSWIRTAIISLHVWRNRPFNVIQACNPPDTYWLLAAAWRTRGVRFVFDHHDLNPELFISRFGEPDDWLHRLEYRALLWLERMTFWVADRVISTNTSYRSVAISRGGLRPEHATVVRSGPDTAEMRPIYPSDPRPPGTINLVYIGIMGPQDGVDQVLLVMDEIVHRRGRNDVTATMLGFGDCLEELRAQCTQLSLDDKVTFTGRVDKFRVADYLSRADIGVGPDLKTPLNDVSTMNKTMEYMSFGLPTVSFDLVETRVSGEDCVLYVESGDISAFADAVERLIDDPKLRVEVGRRARARAETVLDWRPQAEAYVGVFDELTGFSRTGPAVPPAELRPTDQLGRRYVDLQDEEEFVRYLIQRSAL